MHGERSVAVEEVPDPTLARPTDALVRVVASCICGSDLWPYRGYREVHGRIGHEFVGVIEEAGPEVSTLRAGDLVIAPFVWSCGTCPPCRAGWQTSCLVGGNYGVDDRDGILVDGGQGERVRVPRADGTLVAAPVDEHDERMAALLALSDVMSTGHHAAISAGVEQGGSVAVIGDGAVGLCAVLAAARLGARRIIALSTHADRAELARSFGATDVVAARGREAVDGVLELTDGLGVDSVCECVGMASSWQTAVDAVRAGGTVGWVGVPTYLDDGLPARTMFDRNLTVRGGVAPARRYIPELLADVLDGTLDPAPVFTASVPLADVADGYRAMDERREIKVMLTP